MNPHQYKVGDILISKRDRRMTIKILSITEDMYEIISVAHINPNFVGTTSKFKVDFVEEHTRKLSKLELALK